MKKNNKPGLKNNKKIIKPSCHHKINDHPHEHIATHVVTIVFISLFFLIGAFMFLIAEPSPTTAHAIVDFSQINLGIGDKISEVTDTFLDPQYRTELLFILYISWIMIVGVVSLYYTERQLKG
ncbi:MAG: hypothetical protein ACOCZQ_03415 [Nanoarchaeota archaeon]